VATLITGATVKVTYVIDKPKVAGKSKKIVQIITVGGFACVVAFICRISGWNSSSMCVRVCLRAI